MYIMLCWMLNQDIQHVEFSRLQHHRFNICRARNKCWTVLNELNRVKRSCFLLTVCYSLKSIICHFRAALYIPRYQSLAWIPRMDGRTYGRRINCTQTIRSIRANEDHYPRSSSTKIHKIDPNLPFSKNARRGKSLDAWSHGFDHICL